MALGSLIMSFGLTGLIFAPINSLFFGQDTYHFLLFLAFSTGSFIFMGSIFLIKLPPEELLSDEVVVLSPSSSSAALDQLHDKERTPITLSKQQQRDEELEPHIGGWELFQNTAGLSISFIAFLLAGVGLMYVNNVGAIIKTLYLSSDPHEDEVQNFQNLHVAL